MHWTEIAGALLPVLPYLAGYWQGRCSAYRRGFNAGWAESERHWSAKVQASPKLFAVPATWPEELRS